MEGLDALLTVKPIDSTDEVGAYEFLSQQRVATTKRIEYLFQADPGYFLSELLDEADAALAADKVFSHLTSR